FFYAGDRRKPQIAAFALRRAAFEVVGGYDSNALLVGAYDPFDLCRKWVTADQFSEANIQGPRPPIPSKSQQLTVYRQKVIQMIQPNLLVQRPRSVGDWSHDFLAAPQPLKVSGTALECAPRNTPAAATPAGSASTQLGFAPEGYWT